MNVIVLAYVAALTVPVSMFVSRRMDTGRLDWRRAVGYGMALFVASAIAFIFALREPVIPMGEAVLGAFQLTFAGWVLDMPLTLCQEMAYLILSPLRKPS